MNLSITGFGACMIAGYPLSPEAGFLHQAVQCLHQTGEFKVTLDVVTMGGFPAHRAQKHLTKRVLALQPEVVVLQFGSTDASAPLRNNFISRRHLHDGTHTSEKVLPQPPNSREIWKWKLRSLASELLLVPPLTPLKIYGDAMLEMVQSCRASGCKVVVVSPFVMGSGRSNRFARCYTNALQQQLPKTPEVHFVNAHTLLSQMPRKRMLLRDGFHLSAEAHQKLGTKVAEALSEVVRKPA